MKYIHDFELELALSTDQDLFADTREAIIWKLRETANPRTQYSMIMLKTFVIIIFMASSIENTISFMVRYYLCPQRLVIDDVLWASILVLLALLVHFGRIAMYVIEELVYIEVVMRVQKQFP